MKLNANGMRLIEELKLQDAIGIDIQKIAQEIKSATEKESRYRWLIGAKTVLGISARYLLDIADAKAVYKAYDKLESYGVPYDKRNFSLELALSAYILEKCFEKGQLDKSYLDIFKKLEEEYWGLLGEKMESRS